MELKSSDKKSRSVDAFKANIRQSSTEVTELDPRFCEEDGLFRPERL